MKTILTGILIVLQGILFAGEITLIQDGRPNAEIVLGEKPTVSAQLAAFELNHHFRLITGIELPVSAKATAAPGIKIHLGTAYVPSRIEYSDGNLKSKIYVPLQMSRSYKTSIHLTVKIDGKIPDFLNFFLELFISGLNYLLIIFDPAHAACKSNAPAFSQPRISCTTQAVDGNVM